ncbi:rare lipoprotein A (RlpA)-like double-psi beta-barrel domain-containing protein [Rhizoctonia solani AG-1 IA]|uniref:Rare lipoprotein A (RlpA)-like double-psi beta-barrel domain-containing protein n=1 Tax=Thanatephorus cucumeris (strain AG1-IA) TaxID=983506 RepID=L8WGL0_THACA|nr:rare lipoprotein A (RlpA)-like double-psi beta-barrel domain-containing protein [Rhizoctonia solani AG-1 IA]
MNSVDLSPNAFEALAPLSQGVLPVSWHFMNRNWSP